MNQQVSGVNRRTAIRLAGGAALALPLALRVRAAAALRTWCRTDPVIAINRRVANIFVSGPEGAGSLTTGAIKVVVTVPTGFAKKTAVSEGRSTRAWRDRARRGTEDNGVTTRLISTDHGFGHGYQVVFVESSRSSRPGRGAIPVKVAIFVPATDDAMPVLLEWQPERLGRVTAQRRGTANAWVALRTSI